MENQTRFDLNAAIESWRQELAAQPNLASGDRRELETHLRDAIAGFQQRGLSDEESFWLARRRVGQPPQLGEEFVKTDPAKVWRERVFWMALALIAISLWREIVPILLVPLPWSYSGFAELKDPLLRRIAGSIQYPLLMTLPILGCVILLACGGMRRGVAMLQSLFFQSRLRFIAGMGALIVVITVCEELIISPGGPSARFSYFGAFAHNFLNGSTLPLALTILIAWLMPTQNRKKPKSA